MKKTFGVVATLLVGLVAPATAQQGFFCDRDQWANAEQVAGATALITHFPDIVTAFWSDLSDSNLMLSGEDRRKLTDVGNKLTDRLFAILLETAGIGAVLREGDETRINSIMGSLRGQLVELSGSGEFSGPATYEEFRRAAIRCVADFDGENDER